MNISRLQNPTLQKLTVTLQKAALFTNKILYSRNPQPYCWTTTGLAVCAGAFLE